MKWNILLVALIVAVSMPSTIQAFGFSIYEVEFEEKLIPEMLYINKITINASEDVRLRLFFTCEKTPDFCDWASWAGRDRNEREILIEIPKDSRKDVYFEILVPEEFEPKQREMEIHIAGTQRTEGEIAIPYVLKVVRQFSFWDHAVIYFQDFWNEKYYEFPSEQLPPIYGSSVVMIASSLIFLIVIVYIVKWGRGK